MSYTLSSKYEVYSDIFWKIQTDADHKKVLFGNLKLQ